MNETKRFDPPAGAEFFIGTDVEELTEIPFFSVTTNGRALFFDSDGKPISAVRLDWSPVMSRDDWLNKVEALNGKSVSGLPQQPAEKSANKFRLWDAVIEAGFVVSPNRFGAELKYRGVQLSATESLSRQFRPVVLVCGLYVSRARMAKIDQELPQEVDSRELALAFLAWALEPLAETLLKDGGSLPAWWSEGQLHRDLLPWEREKARWAAMPDMPNCRLEYDWARIAFRTLGDLLRSADPLSDVKIEFDGEILRMRCAGKLVAVAAQGNAWPESVTILVTDIQKLPTRLSRRGVEVSVRDDALIIDRHYYRRRSPEVGTIHLGPDV